MNKTKIEWCDSSWNPVLGCRHDCPYCYAKRIADRFRPKSIVSEAEHLVDPETRTDIRVLNEPVKGVFSGGVQMKAAYPYGFEPTYLHYRLKELKTQKLGKTIFVCSMADLFGEWVPDSVIEEVLQACVDAPEHRYLFLTKNPSRYIELAEKGVLPSADNFWYGSTVGTVHSSAFWADGYHVFLSMEPILEPFPDAEHSANMASCFDWLILGAETGQRKGKAVPERSWIEGAVEAFQAQGKPVFMKDSMKPVWGEDILTQFPWDNE